MAHVLGVGTMWEPFGLLVGGGHRTSPGLPERMPSVNTTPSSALRRRELPVENTGGPGTRDGHWRESIFAQN